MMSDGHVAPPPGLFSPSAATVGRRRRRAAAAFARKVKAKKDEIKYEDFCVDGCNTNLRGTDEKEPAKKDLIQLIDDLTMQLHKQAKAIMSLKDEIVEMQARIQRVGEFREKQNKELHMPVEEATDTDYLRWTVQKNSMDNQGCCPTGPGSVHEELRAPFVSSEDVEADVATVSDTVTERSISVGIVPELVVAQVSTVEGPDADKQIWDTDQTIKFFTQMLAQVDGDPTLDSRIAIVDKIKHSMANVMHHINPQVYQLLLQRLEEKFGD